MAALTKDDVRHIAKLCRLTIAEEDLERFTNDLTNILDYFSILEEVDTSDAEQMMQVTGLSNMFREDEVAEPEASREELLDCSPLPIVDNQIETPSAHG